MGGGGSKAKTKSDVVNDFISKSIAESIMNCNNQSSVSQQIDVHGNYNIVKNVNMKQAFKLTSTCFQDAKVMNKLVNDISNSIKQAADAQNIALLGALSNSEAEVDNYIYNGVKNEIQSSSIQNIVNETNADQGIGIWGNHNIVEDITMNQVVDMISKNSQSVINDADFANATKSAVDQAASAKQENPLDAITDMVGKVMDGTMAPVKMIAMAVGLVIIMIAWSIFGGGGGEAANRLGAINQAMQSRQRQAMMARRLPPGAQQRPPPGAPPRPPPGAPPRPPPRPPGPSPPGSPQPRQPRPPPRQPGEPPPGSPQPRPPPLRPPRVM